MAVSNPTHAIVISDDVAARTILPSELKTAFDLRIGKSCEWHAKDQNDCPSPMAIKRRQESKNLRLLLSVDKLNPIILVINLAVLDRKQ
jgi:hypothetical protein